MDIRDDPSTTTTTDYDSGDSDGVDYVYEGKKGTDKRSTKERSPRRKRSPKAKPRGVTKCTCGAGRAEEDAETTAFEEDTDTEEERNHQRCQTKTRPSSGPGCDAGCDGKGHHRADRRPAAEPKARRVRTPYIEEYPDDVSRPAVLLREHKVLRRSSTSDAKRVRNSEDCSLSSGSRGRSPTGRRLPPRPPRRSSKESPKHPRHRKRRVDSHGAYEGKLSNPDDGDFQSESDEPDPAPRRFHHKPGPQMTSAVARSLAWNEKSQPRYSSSLPLHAGSHLARRPERRDHDYDSEEEDDEQQPFDDDDDDDREDNYAELHRSRPTQAPSFRERVPEREREPIHLETPPSERERERGRPSPPRPRPRTIVSRASTTTMNQGYHSVATSMCEVWRGEAEDWESPYASASDGDYESDLEEPIGLLRMEDVPPRRSSPRLFPPRGERRDFGFQATHHSPPAYPPHPSLYLDEPPAGPVSRIHRNPTWPTTTPARNGLFLLDDGGGPLALTMEPDAMTDEEDDECRPPSRASRWSRPGPSRGWTQPLPPRSRAVSPVFSARRTREFLSPRPTKAARFDFGAWGCDRASRSSLGLGLL
ncbi:hypothetical protein C8A00DRAFT_45752 [Chaetomidium leptoderma]|uniref:Uncharacterized protein n=1 Tax=Chaetomidium leptoderma TaxID=669021 RepID=A0AAN6VGQ2_9PEZI|nr:hypothetical protein C8A00DRAFT_45752 [Chaetomidium leptoderma]